MLRCIAACLWECYSQGTMGWIPSFGRCGGRIEEGGLLSFQEGLTSWWMGEMFVAATAEPVRFHGGSRSAGRVEPRLFV